MQNFFASPKNKRLILPGRSVFRLEKENFAVKMHPVRHRCVDVAHVCVQKDLGKIAVVDPQTERFGVQKILVVPYNARLAGVFHGQMNPAPGYEQLRLKGLEPGKRYHLRTRAQKIRIGQFAHMLKHVVPVSVNPEGGVLAAADKRIGLEDGVEGYHVTGAALNSGIMLLPLFRGTGYDKNQRTQGDYGSSLYLIEAE